jgi:uncharacterized protein YjiS (DUF1127 family)
MSYAQLTTTQNHSTGWIADRLKRAYGAFLDWQARRATREILRALDGRTLKDIGLDANEIDSVVYAERDDRMHRCDAKWMEKARG